jgi:hypothetical protein
MVPDFLSHYYDASTGPFRSLTDLDPLAAESLQESIRASRKEFFASQRKSDYVAVRRELESRVRQLFTRKGGRPRRLRPLYAVLGSCPWLLDWYPNGRELRVPLAQLSPEVISFTYGDTFPAMRIQDDMPFRGQVYTLAELPDLIDRFGLPQEVNPDGRRGPERYVEAQIWSDEFLDSVDASSPGR